MSCLNIAKGLFFIVLTFALAFIFDPGNDFNVSKPKAKAHKASKGKYKSTEFKEGRSFTFKMKDLCWKKLKFIVISS